MRVREVLLLALVVGVHVVSARRCNCQCPQTYQPICAKDSSGDMTTFPSQCHLNCQNCVSATDYRLQYQGECRSLAATTALPKPKRSGKEPKCNCQCPSGGHLLCAKDSSGATSTFPSQCHLNCHNCAFNADFRKQHDGNCRDTSTNAQNNKQGNNRKGPECNCQCPNGGRSLCAKDSSGDWSSFPSQCHLTCYNCVNVKDYRKQHDGDCRNAAQINRKKDPECNCRCPTGGQSLCAKDSTGDWFTFPSQCHLACQNCLHNKDYRKQYDGDCRSTSTTNRRNGPECNCRCPTGGQSLCAKDSTGDLYSFPSQCHLTCHNCLHDKDYRKQYDGDCRSSSSNTRSRGRA